MKTTGNQNFGLLNIYSLVKGTRDSWGCGCFQGWSKRTQEEPEATCDTRKGKKDMQKVCFFKDENMISIWIFIAKIKTWVAK